MASVFPGPVLELRCLAANDPASHRIDEVCRHAGQLTVSYVSDGSSDTSDPHRRSLNFGCPFLSDVFHVALKEISQLLHRGTERNPKAEFG